MEEYPILQTIKFFGFMATIVAVTYLVVTYK